MMNEAVQHAINQIAALDYDLLTEEDGSGGAFVVASGVKLESQYKQRTTWVGFHVTHLCPYADTYPHFVRPDLERVDGQPLGEGFGTVEWPGLQGRLGEILGVKNAVQLSRKSNRKDSEGLETPLVKLLKVLQWLNSR